MTLNSAMALIVRYFTEFSSFLGPATLKWLKTGYTLSATLM